MTARLRPDRLATTAWPHFWLPLALIALDAGLVVARVLLYEPLFAQPGAFVFVLEPLVLLFLYAGIVLAVARARGFFPDRLQALRVGTVTGLVTGAIWVANLGLETFTDLSSPMGILSTAPFLLGAFVLWGIAAARMGWMTDTLASGVLVAVWGAMLCVLLTIAFGLVLTYSSIDRLEQILATDPDYLRSRWSDIQAFAIANSFDSAFSHLLVAPIVACVVGAAGGLIGAYFGGRKRQERRTTRL